MTSNNKITVHFRDYVIQKYGLEKFEGNRSSFIEAHFVLGCETAIGGLKGVQEALMRTQNELAEAHKHIVTLKRKLGAAKARSTRTAVPTSQQYLKQPDFIPIVHEKDWKIVSDHEKHVLKTALDAIERDPGYTTNQWERYKNETANFKITIEEYKVLLQQADNYFKEQEVNDNEN